MKFEKLVILSNNKKSQLGLGDYLRVASFLPNIKCNQIIWYSCKKLKIILQEIDYLNKIKNFNNFKLKILKKNDLLINLTNNNILFSNVININDFSNNEKDFKMKTVNLLKLLCNKLKLNKYKLFSNEENKITKNKIFINWQVPNKWKIKSYSNKKWNFIIKKLKNHKQKNFEIEWQKKNGNLKYLINQIKESKLVVSVVSLACHLAILFNKKLITLSGPNYFEDLKLYKKSVVIYTKKKCAIHKKKLNIFSKNCYCMNFINQEEVYKKIVNEL
jgi:hypothetical protein